MLTTLLILFILLVLSAFFSASETGLTGVSRAKIYRMKAEGNKRAVLVSKLREEKETLIGALLLGNNAINIAASAIATTFAIEYINDEDAVIYTTIIMTALVLVFSEVLPKTYAIKNPEKVALALSPMVNLVAIILSPISNTVQALVDGIFRVFGIIDSDSKRGKEDLRGAIHMHHHEGTVVKSHRDMLDSILDLSEMEVGEIMIHRREMESFNAGETKEKIINFTLSSIHSRVPLWRGNPDNIIGVLHTKDVVKEIRNTGNYNDVDIDELIRDPWFIPETTPVGDQLNAFRKKRNHFALVVDEYGDLLGLITLEDILEEIVGEIEEEHVDVRKRIKPSPDGSYTIDGNVSIREINRNLNWNLPDTYSSTLAGLVISKAQMIPNIGQVFSFFGYRFEVLKKQRNKITSVRVTKNKKKKKAAKK